MLICTKWGWCFPLLGNDLLATYLSEHKYFWILQILWNPISMYVFSGHTRGGGLHSHLT